MRARANDRALKNLGVRELNLGSLPEGVKIVNLPNPVSEKSFPGRRGRLGGACGCFFFLQGERMRFMVGRIAGAGISHDNGLVLYCVLYCTAVHFWE